MANRILYADEIANEARQQGQDSKQAAETVQRVATEQTPMYLGMVQTVKYDAKTDRYVAAFHDSSAKVANDVAAYLIQHAVPKGSFGRMLPTVYANMNDQGMIDAVTLLFISRS